MYVRKFEGESLDETLQVIKRELGPDAIILKTITNKGLKGAFKKKKIEITAAISEQNYERKMKVDTIIPDGNKDNFYKSSSGYLSQVINKPSSDQGYSNVGVNRQVRTVNDNRDEEKSERSSLDAFLSASETVNQEVVKNEKEEQESSREEQSQNTQNLRSVDAASVKRIEDLERKLYDLTRSVEKIDQKEPDGLFNLRKTLSSFDINSSYVKSIIKKSLFELGEDDLGDEEVVFEFALRDMLDKVNVKMPLFSNSDVDKEGVITVLLSETSVGQTSMLYKLASLKENSVVIRYCSSSESTERTLAEKMFEFPVIVTSSIGEMVSHVRKTIESGKSVFIDYQDSRNEKEETKKFIDGLSRSFSNVEVLITLSSIHSEIYNRKVLSKYGQISDGVVVTHLDLCLSFSSLFNIALDHQTLPFKFYGTGDIIPDDLESATAERIMAGIFQL